MSWICHKIDENPALAGWSQEPKTGTKKRLDSVMDFACGSGSLLLNEWDMMRAIEKSIRTATDKHNEFLRELGLPCLPSAQS